MGASATPGGYPKQITPWSWFNPVTTQLNWQYGTSTQANGPRILANQPEARQWVLARKAVLLADDGGRPIYYPEPRDLTDIAGMRALAVLGDSAYAMSLAMNAWFNAIRRRLGYLYWSLSAYLKHRVKNAVQFIGNYERAVANEARRRGVDGVVCGHIHHAEIRDIDGILYCNDGDWVESCTALVEDFDGRLRIVRWAEEHARESTSRVLSDYAPVQVAAE